GVPTGFATENLTAMSINLRSGGYSDEQSRVSFTEKLMPRLNQLTGIRSVAFSSNLPLDVGLQGTAFKVADAVESPENSGHTYVSIISPGYFQTMGTPLLQGRDFNAGDRAEAP